MKRQLGETLPHGLGDPEIDDLRRGLSILQGDEDVRRLEVAVDDPLLVRVLDGHAGGNEELEPFPDGEFLHVAVLRDGHAADELHHEIWPPRFGSTAIVDRRDVGMVHHGQRLALGLEAGHDLLGVHAELDDLQRDPALDRLGLLGQVDDPHPAFAEGFEDLVGTDALWRLERGFFVGRIGVVRPGAAPLGRSVLAVLRRQHGTALHEDVLNAWGREVSVAMSTLRCVAA